MQTYQSQALESLTVETHDTVMSDAIFKSHAFQWEPSHCDVDHRFVRSDR